MPLCPPSRPETLHEHVQDAPQRTRSAYHDLLGYLRCPVCRRRPLATRRAGLACDACGELYREEEGILDCAPQTDRTTTSGGDQEQARYWEEEEHIYRPYDHEVALGFAAQRAAYLKSVLPLDNVYSAVDVGAGNGMSTYCHEPDIHTIFSTDLSRRLLRQNPGRFRLRCDAYNLPLRDKIVDMAYAWELLHHVEQPREVLTEMHRVARKYVYFFEPNCWNPAQAIFAWLHPPDRLCLRNTREYLMAEGEAAGLKLVHHATVGWMTPNLTPVPVYRVFRHLPFAVPWIGLSHFLLFKCD